MRRGVLLAGMVAAAFVLGVPAAEASDSVSIKTGSATSFSGTDKNTSAQKTNFVSIGTGGPSGAKQNPVTSFTYAGKKCLLYPAYGSAYCAVSVAPGKTVSFSGKTKSPPSFFVFCTSSNSGTSNDCQNIAVPGGSTGSAADVLKALQGLQAHLRSVLAKVKVARSTSGVNGGPSLGKQIAGLGKELDQQVAPTFTQSLNGIPASTILTEFETVDFRLNLAIDLVRAGGHPIGASQALQLAADLVSSMGVQLVSEGKAPKALLTALNDLNSELSDIAKLAGQGTLTVNRIDSAIEQKHHLITTYFNQSLYGANAGQTIVQFDAIGNALAAANASWGMKMRRQTVKWLQDGDRKLTKMEKFIRQAM